MARWDPNARERLRAAAMELFAEQGFAATTVPEITARAGLTRRTFFRYFADKREVLFGGAEIAEFARQQLAAVPASVDPVAALELGMRAAAEQRFEGRRDEIRFIRDLVRSDEGLRERDLAKRAALARVATEVLVERGTSPLAAALLGETSVTVLMVATDAWLDQPGDDPLVDFIERSLEALRGALAPVIHDRP